MLRQELLDLAQLEAGELKIICGKINLREQLSGVRERFTPLLLEKDITLEIADISPELFVLTDSRRLDQVLNNLVSNAVRHSPAGSQINIIAVKKGAFAHVSVIDHGEGIGADDLPHIWERFYRAEKSRSRGGGGSGIGLAVTQKLVSAMGGEISVQSTLGRGSTFSFALSLCME